MGRHVIDSQREWRYTGLSVVKTVKGRLAINIQRYGYLLQTASRFVSIDPVSFQPRGSGRVVDRAHGRCLQAGPVLRLMG